MEINNKQRKEYLSWDEFFMGVAILASERSKDPNTQVGACIVSADNRILSVGYNGTPNGFEDIYFPWDREGDELNTKYLYVVHAERNAILKEMLEIADTITIISNGRTWETLENVGLTSEEVLRYCYKERWYEKSR